MKSAIDENKKEQSRNYPYLGELGFDNLVILFTEPRTGIVVSQGNGWDIGDNNDSWNESDFKPFNGKVILSND